MIVPLRIARAVLVLFTVCGGCDPSPGDGPVELPACVDVDPAACTPLYAPEFSNVMSETLAPRCGVAGGACHGQDGAEGALDGGLVLVDAEASHAILREGEGAGGEPFVRPGDAACSLLVVRLAVDDPDLRMPPGAAALEDTELCSIAQWIEQGAQR